MAPDARFGAGLIDDERGEAVAPISDVVNALERSGAEATRTRYRIAADKAIELLDELRMLLACDRSATAGLAVQRVALDAPAAATLEALVELVERDGRRIFVTRDGAVLAELVP